MTRLLMFCWLTTLTACAGPQATETRAAGASDDDRVLTVGFLLLEGVYNSELAAPFDVFHHTVFHTQPGMRVLTIGRTRRPIRSFEGLTITPDTDLAHAPHLDILVIPSAEHNMDSDLEDSRLLKWLKQRGQQAGYLLSVCDGAFLLAEAGLLDGHQCTTFPGDLEAFRQRYPHLEVIQDVSFVADGNTITGAGGALSYDPALYLAEVLYGNEVARGIGKGLVLDWNVQQVRHHITPPDSRKRLP